MRRAGLVMALLFAVTACKGTLPPSPTAPTPAPTVMGSPTANPAPNPPDPSASQDPMVGRYTLNVTLGAGCESLPETARNRTYAASIDAARAAYVVTLSDASFLGGSICTAAPSRLGCNQFVASRADDVFQFDLINENDDGHGGHIVEQIPPGTWMEMIGRGTGQIADGTITATGSASVWYCSTVSAYPFPCRAFVGCRSDGVASDLHA